MKLEGRVAVITGAGSGMGRGMALLFAQEGAKVVAVDWVGESAEETVRLIETEAKGEAVAVKADVSSAEDVDRMISTAVERFGGVDILCNNAGILDMKPCTEIDDAWWDKVIGVNLKGVFLGCRRAIPEMLKRGKGAIVNTASIAGLLGGAAGMAYTVSKHGVIGVTRSVAAQYGPQGIRCNAICPGAVETGMTRDMLKDPATLQWLTSTPIRRVGQPADIAQAALYLASDDSSFVTGALLVVDGGWVVR
ncbi:MAG: glucose 1-dehydrogenase [Bacillota bacterium]|nr:glucose 1-dehydrogenase [Bacillota bacterium]